MSPRTDVPPVASRPRRGGGLVACAAALAFALAAGPVRAQEAEDGEREESAQARGEGGDEQVFEFSGLDIGGRLRTPQLLYFLDRAREELRQASLERRSFLPEMVRSVDEESL